jgi:hypothetical protein
MASFRPSRKGLAIAGAVAVGVVAMPTAASASGLLGLGDLLGLSQLCNVSGLLSIVTDGSGCGTAVPISVGDLKGPKGDTGATGPQGPQGTAGTPGGPAGPAGAKGDAGAAGAAGVAGPAGAKGATGANGVSGYQVVSKQETLKAGQAMTWTVSCSSGKKVTSGGVRSTSAGSFLVQGSGPSSSSGTGWTVTMVNVSKKSHKITGYAVCASV